MENNAYYLTIQGDTFDIIAYRWYGDETMAQVLMQDPLNIELLDYEIFPAGIYVHLPEVAEEDDDIASGLPAWRRAST